MSRGKTQDFVNNSEFHIPHFSFSLAFCQRLRAQSWRLIRDFVGTDVPGGPFLRRLIRHTRRRGHSHDTFSGRRRLRRGCARLNKAEQCKFVLTFKNAVCHTLSLPLGDGGPLAVDEVLVFSTAVAKRCLACHPERREVYPKTQSQTRDLRVGAFYLLSFGKGGEESAELRVDSLSASRLPTPKFAGGSIEEFPQSCYATPNNGISFGMTLLFIITNPQNPFFTIYFNFFIVLYCIFKKIVI